MDFSQNSFSSGQVSSELISRQDMEKYPTFLKEAVNVNIYPTGHLHTRLGTYNILKITENTKIILYPYEDRLFVLLFTPNAITVYENIALKHKLITTIDGDIGLDIKSINFTLINQEILLGDGKKPLKLFTYLRNKDKPEPENFKYHDYNFTHVPTNVTFFGEFLLGDPVVETGVEAQDSIVKFTSTINLLDGDNGRKITNNEGAVGSLIKFKKSSPSSTNFDIEIYVERGKFNKGDTCKFLSPPFSGLESTSGNEGSVATLSATAPLSKTKEGELPKKDYEVFHTGGLGIPERRSEIKGKFIVMNGGVYEVIKHVGEGTGKVSQSAVEALVVSPPTSIERTEDWSIHELTWKEGYYPNFISVYQGRLILGRKLQLWASERGDYTSFVQGVGTSSAFKIDIEGDRHADIEFMATSNDLIIGTNEKEYSIGGDSTGVFSNASLRIKSASRYGSENHKPAVLGNEIIFIQSGSKKLRSLQYRFNVDNYEANDLSYYSQSLTEKILTKVIELSSIVPTLYLLTQDGEVLNCIYDKFNEVVGWTHFKQGEGKVLNIYSVVAFNNDIVYYKTLRNGEYFLEWNIPYSEKDNLVEDTYLDSTLEFQYPVHLDNTDDLSSLEYEQKYKIIDTSFKEVYKTLTYNSISSRSNLRDENTGRKLTYKDDKGNKQIFKSDRPFTLYKLFDIVKSGDYPLLQHYQNKDLSIVADGAVLPKSRLKVDDLNGVYLKVGYPVYNLKIGYGYDMRVKTLPPQINVGNSSFLFGDKTKIAQCKLLVEKSTLPVVNKQRKPAHETGDKTDQPTKLRSGVYSYTLSHYTEIPELEISNTHPTPVKLLGIYYKVKGG